MIFKHYLWK